MFSSTTASSFQVALGRLSVHQDLLWFTVLVGWSLVFALWWRHPLRESLWRLLPWIAAVRVLGAMVQFLVFDPPFDLFIERLMPGANELYEPAVLDPNLTADLVLAALSYGLVYLWLWQDTSSRPQRLVWRALGAAALVLAVPAHLVWPEASAWVLALLPVVPALRVIMQPTNRNSPLWILLLPAFAPLFSTVGPLAWYTGLMQRTATSTPMGAVAAIYQAGVSALLLLHLWRLQPRSAERATLVAAWRVGRPFFLTAAVVLVIGVGFALQTGEDNRREIINNRVRATQYNADLLNPAEFAVFSSPDFRLEDVRVNADGTGTARAPGLAPAITRAGRALAARVRATQFQEKAGFLVLKDGWLVEAAGTTPRTTPDAVVLRGRSTPDDEAAWREMRLYVRSSPVPEQGTPYYCRAPLAGDDGRMLGWLEYPRHEFYSSMARKWRTSPLLVTAMGLVITAALYFQKRSNHERERAAREAAVAAEANRLKTAFLAKVSHELRTPIQSLLGYGELLRSRLGDDAQAQAWLGALQQHGEIMTRLINDLIDLSAAESGSFRLVPRPVEPGAIVRQIVASLEPRAAVKGLRLDCTVTAAVPAWVEADGGRLAQIVLNLVGNALKFTDDGSVAVTLDAASSGGAGGPVRLLLTVRDTGPGISPADQARLFAPFSRLERTAAKEGSGLGLALCAVLCRAMGGQLTVESDGVTGSCFSAAVVVPPADAPAAPVPLALAGGSPRRVLVVDDNTLIRELFVTFLQTRGCDCAAASTGAEAVAHATARTPEVVVLDLSLPDTDGIALAGRLRALAPSARLIGVSAHAGEVERARALQAGMAAFHTKPVALETLWASLTASTAVDAAPATFTVPPHLREVFLQELPALRAELAAAVAGNDFRAAARRAHYLRSSALVLQEGELLSASTELEAVAARAAPEAAMAAWRRCDTVIAGILQRAA